MALTPQAMMQLRRGPTQGPTPNPGGAGGGGPPGAGMPANPAAADPGNLVMAAIAERMNQAKKANSNFAISTLEQILRVISTMQIHTDKMLPAAARDLNRGWAALDQARKKFSDAIKESAVPSSPQLGFSGAQIGPSQANPLTAGGPGGLGGGGMGVPS